MTIPHDLTTPRRRKRRPGEWLTMGQAVTPARRLRGEFRPQAQRHGRPTKGSPERLRDEVVASLEERRRRQVTGAFTPVASAFADAGIEAGLVRDRRREQLDRLIQENLKRIEPRRARSGAAQELQTPEAEAFRQRMQEQSGGLWSDLASSLYSAGRIGEGLIDVATGIPSFVRDPSLANAGWAAASVVPIGKVGRVGRAAGLGKLAGRLSRAEAYRGAASPMLSSPSMITRLGQHELSRASTKLGRKVDVWRESDRAIARAIGKVFTPVSARARVPKMLGKEAAWTKRRTMVGRSVEQERVLGAHGVKRFATAYYMQLPKALRNPEGLRRVRERVLAEIDDIRSGRAAAELQSEIDDLGRLIEEAKATDDPGMWRLIQRQSELKGRLRDLPKAEQDLALQARKLARAAERNVRADDDLLDALDVLGRDREEILIRHGVLDPETAAARRGLFTEWVSGEPRIGLEAAEARLAEIEGVLSRMRENVARQWRQATYGGPGGVQTEQRLRNYGKGRGPGKRGTVESVTDESLKAADELMGKMARLESTDPAVREFQRLVVERDELLRHVENLRPDPLGLMERPSRLVPTGEELYLGHRAGRVRGARAAGTAGWTTGKTRLPPGVAQRNQMRLLATGRWRQDIRVALEDWRAAQVFDFAENAKTDLVRMGEPLDRFLARHAGSVPDGKVLVNPLGRRIPLQFRRDLAKELADQGFEGDLLDELVQAVDEIDTAFATDPEKIKEVIAKSMEIARKTSAEPSWRRWFGRPRRDEPPARLNDPGPETDQGHACRSAFVLSLLPPATPVHALPGSREVGQSKAGASLTERAGTRAIAMAAAIVPSTRA